MARNITALVLGFLVTFTVVFAVLALSALLFPPPPGLDPSAPEPGALEAYTATLPVAAWALTFGGEVLGAFLGAWAAGAVAGSRPVRFAGAIVGLALAGSIMNWLAFPHPLWFMVGQVAAYGVAFWAAVRLLRGRQGPDALARDEAPA